MPTEVLSPYIILNIVINWLLVGVWLTYGILQVIEGSLHGYQLAGITAIALFLGSASTGFHSAALPITAFMLITSGVAPLVANSLKRRAHIMIDAELAQGYVESLIDNPNNLGSRLKLSEELYRAGFIGAAIHHLQIVVATNPLVFQQEANVLKKWINQASRINVEQHLWCPTCGESNPIDALVCRKCYSRLIYNMIASKWAPSGIPSNIYRLWIFCAIIILLGPPAAIFLPAYLSLPIVIGLLVLGIYTAWKSVKVD